MLTVIRNMTKEERKRNEGRGTKERKRNREKTEREITKKKGKREKRKVRYKIYRLRIRTQLDVPETTTKWRDLCLKKCMANKIKSLSATMMLCPF